LSDLQTLASLIVYFIVLYTPMCAAVARLGEIDSN
jgi:hypothetical protein